MALRLASLEAAAVFAAVWLSLSQPGAHRADLVAWHALIVAVCSVSAFHRWHLYEPGPARRFAWSAPRVVLAMAGVAAIVGAAHRLLAGRPIAPVPLLCALAAALGLVLCVRAAACGWIAHRSAVERVLILGGGSLAAQLVEAIESRARRRQRLLGLVDDGGHPPSRLHLGALRELDRIVEDARADRVVVALASRRGHMPFKTLLGLRVRGIAVEDGAECYERLTGKVPIEALTPTNLIFGKDACSGRLDRALAWSLSLSTAVIGLLMLAPLFVLIALAIKLDSAGPVFFIQPRVGRGGRLFRLIKFRTMRPVSVTTSEWARDNRGRLTRVGAWLRRYRLDELPQFVNVAKGDMSLIGPRPHPVSNLPLLVLAARNTPECGEPIPFYALRSLVRPGITGWAQVRYRYANDLDEEIEKMRYDMYYIKHRSFALDLRILLETVRIVVRGRESVERREPARLPATDLAAPIAVRAPAPRVASAALGLDTAVVPDDAPPAAPPGCREVVRA